MTSCSSGGSGAFSAAVGGGVHAAIEAAKTRVADKGGKKFIAYYQSYTGTYAPLDRLRALYTETLSHPDVVALSIGTRPDCLPDEVIALLQKQIELLKKQKKGFLQKMFPAKGCTVPEIRFEGFSGEWEQRRFSDFTFPAGERNKADLDLVPYAITNNQGFIPQKDAHDDFGYMKDVDRKMYIIVKPNSFAYNPARISVGSLGYYTGTENVIVSSLYEVFQTKDYVNDTFLMHWFKTKTFQDWIERLSEGSVRLYFYYDKLCECKIKMPSYEEQRKIGEFFDGLDSIIAIHQRKLELEQQKKKALMQLLLTGKVRCIT